MKTPLSTQNSLFAGRSVRGVEQRQSDQLLENVELGRPPQPPFHNATVGRLRRLLRRMFRMTKHGRVTESAFALPLLSVAGLYTGVLTPCNDTAS